MISRMGRTLVPGMHVGVGNVLDRELPATPRLGGSVLYLLTCTAPGGFRRNNHLSSLHSPTKSMHLFDANCPYQ
jgi:hypothetical protein